MPQIWAFLMMSIIMYKNMQKCPKFGCFLNTCIYMFINHEQMPKMWAFFDMFINMYMHICKNGQNLSIFALFINMYMRNVKQVLLSVLQTLFKNTLGGFLDPRAPARFVASRSRFISSSRRILTRACAVVDACICTKHA